MNFQSVKNIQIFFSDFPFDLVTFRSESSDKHIEASDNTVCIS